MENKKVMQMALDALITAELDGNCEYGATDALRTALAQPEKEWVRLTQDDIYKISEKCGLMDAAWEDVMNAIEAKLKDKNK